MSTYQGMRLVLLHGENAQEHWHPEIDVLFTVQGPADVHIQGRTVHMDEEDIFLINSSLPHSVDCPEGTVLCCVKYPWRMVWELLGTGAVVFRCSSAEDKSRSYHDLRGIFRALVYYYLRGRRKTDCLLDSHLLKLLDCLVEHYIVELPGEGGAVSDEARLQQIFQYVNQNYRESVGLSHLASEMYVSPSTLSRFFKKETGMGFVEYLSQVRVHAAALELEQTDENVTKIAVNCGFSNLSVFNRAFRERQGVSPTEYRRLRREAMAAERESERAYIASVRERLSESETLVVQEPGFTERRRRIQVEADAAAGETFTKNWNQVVNIGPVSMLSYAGMREHVLDLTENIGFTYVRLWDVFSKRLMLTDGEHLGGYNYTQIDSVLDFLVSHRIKPWLDFGSRPATITRDESGFITQEHTYIDFKSRRAWEHLLRDFIRHIANRYGRGEVSQWIFELSYIFTTDDSDALYADGGGFDFLAAYAYFHKTVKEHLPFARVGGPGAIPGWMEERQRDFLLGCRELGCVPDFWSMLLFPYYSEEGRRSPVAHRSSDPHSEEEQLRGTRELLREGGLHDCKLFVAEWSFSISDRNLLNDSTYRAAYIAQKLPKIWDAADLIAVSVGSDLLGSHYDTYAVVSGGMGLLTADSIRKPAYFSLQMLNTLGLTLVERGENYVVTRAQDGSLHILCSNQKHFNSSFYMRAESSFEPGRLDELFEDMDPIELTFTLRNMPRNAVCTVKARSISEREGSILGEWQQLQFERDLKPHDIRYLRQACFPRLAMSTPQTQDTTLRFTQTVQPNEVVFLHVYARE